MLCMPMRHEERTAPRSNTPGTLPISWMKRTASAYLKGIILKILQFSSRRKKKVTLIVPHPMLAFKNITF